MSLPLHSHVTCDEIHQRVQTLCHYDDGGVTPPLPSNDIPHPDPLRNSAIYYPLLLLAKLQGPDGIPISSRVGHAIILFFPGEHESCLNPDETGLATPAYEEDSDDEDRANGPGVLIQNQDKSWKVNGDGNQEGDMPAVRWWNSYPPDANTNPETQQPPDTAHEEDENLRIESQLDDSQIISVKHDEARGVFQVLRDYSLRMSIDEEELWILKRVHPLLKMPQFHPTMFVLKMYKPTEVDSSQSSSEDSEEQDKKSK
ncbi:hypothetical protein EDD85DRAFT_785316 [Armillaria nabsnona]|nr:hypothetical protein EDD85DRAFT_785316 [Armillaria nabsnona]